MLCGIVVSADVCLPFKAETNTRKIYHICQLLGKVRLNNLRESEKKWMSVSDEAVIKLKIQIINGKLRDNK